MRQMMDLDGALQAVEMPKVQRGDETERSS